MNGLMIFVDSCLFQGCACFLSCSLARDASAVLQWSTQTLLSCDPFILLKKQYLSYDEISVVVVVYKLRTLGFNNTILRIFFTNDTLSLVSHHVFFLLLLSYLFFCFFSNTLGKKTKILSLFKHLANILRKSQDGTRSSCWAFWGMAGCLELQASEMLATALRLLVSVTICVGLRKTKQIDICPKTRQKRTFSFGSLWIVTIPG